MIGSYLAAQLVIQFLISSPAEGRKKLAQLAGEPGQVLGGSQSSGPVVFGECLTRRSPSKRERDAPQPRSIPTIKVWSHHSYDGSATVDKIAQPSGKHRYVGRAVPTLSKARCPLWKCPGQTQPWPLVRSLCWPCLWGGGRAAFSFNAAQ